MDSFAFGEVQIASNGKQSKSRHNSRTKLRVKLSRDHKRDNNYRVLPVLQVSELTFQRVPQKMV